MFIHHIFIHLNFAAKLTYDFFSWRRNSHIFFLFLAPSHISALHKHRTCAPSSLSCLDQERRTVSPFRPPPWMMPSAPLLPAQRRLCHLIAVSHRRPRFQPPMNGLGPGPLPTCVRCLHTRQHPMRALFQW